MNSQTTALDTNVLSSYLNPLDAQHAVAQQSLARVAALRKLCICPVIHAELLAAPFSSEPLLDEFLTDYGIAVDWQLEPEIWRLAGRSYRAHATARKKQGAPAPRRILADFLIGAHAAQRGYTLLTLDQRVYKNSFPKLRLEGLQPR